MKENEHLEMMRHTAAHVLALAVARLYKDVKFGVGPAVENGFYYDFDFGGQEVTEKDLKRIEKEMRKIVGQKLPVERLERGIDGALEWAKDGGQVYKEELLGDLKEKGTTEVDGTSEDEVSEVSFYKIGEFEDLCRGPHLADTGELGAFKLLRLSGAYWRGDEKNPMMTRIYGVAFETQAELVEHLARLEEAKKRDHRKLGKELDLFIFSDLIGSGMPIYTGRGNIVRNEIIKFSRELQSGIGYEEVHTPNMNRAELFKISGHYDKYKDDMIMAKSHYSEDEFYLKPMNCPQHTQIFAAKARSYKDLPVRIADFANLYRDEKPGELSGLTRLRCFCQDDGHCFAREDQIREEFEAVLTAIQEALGTYGMNYRVRLSLWDPAAKEKYLGEAETWEKSQAILEQILIDNDVEYFRAEGEAAFYGPKMDIMSRDSLGREWQISTIQLDFIMPVRFGLEYVDADGSMKAPVMIHRAIVGSPERFMGILIEHYAGRFPVWLAPEQVRVILVNDDVKIVRFAGELAEKARELGVRIFVDDSNNSVGKKIRNSKLLKVPYAVVIGEKEVESGDLTVNVREDLGAEISLGVDEFLGRVVDEARERSR